MGGRGSSSGMSDNGNKYGTQYSTVLKSGNIKFVKKNDRHGESLLETMTRGRVYAEVNEAGEVVSIYYYDNDLKRTKSIDLRRPHGGMMPHTHHGYLHNENDGPKGATNLTPEERRMVDRVLNLWYHRDAGRSVVSSTR